MDLDALIGGLENKFEGLGDGVERGCASCHRTIAGKKITAMEKGNGRLFLGVSLFLLRSSDTPAGPPFSPPHPAQSSSL
jgi:hypothetical protein